MSTQYLDLPIGSLASSTRIGLAATALNWSEATPDALQIHNDYVLLLSDRLGSALAKTADHPAASALQASLSRLSDEAWLRLITSPRCTYMLLWPSRHETSAVLTFLAEAAEIENLRTASDERASVATEYPGPPARWSVLGDGWEGSDGSFVRGPYLERFPPMDVASPHALAIDLEGVDDQTHAPRQPLTFSEVHPVLDRLAETRDRIAATNLELMAFCAIFTKVLVLQ